MPNYIDCHSHLNFKQFDEDRDEVVARMKKEGVWTITVGTDLKTSKEAVELSQRHDGLFATVGLHPTDWEEGFDESKYEKLVKEEKVVGVGECGLDYYRLATGDEEQKAKQREVFERQIVFAHKHNLPLMLHCRPSSGTMDAYYDVLDILSYKLKANSYKLTGNVHFFVGDTDVARKFLDLGFTISFDGPITFTSAYDAAVRYIPIDRLLAETDAPFAAPEPYRGKRNEPVYVVEIVRALARIRSEDEETLKHQLVENARRVFDISISDK